MHSSHRITPATESGNIPRWQDNPPWPLITLLTCDELAVTAGVQNSHAFLNIYIIFLKLRLDLL